MDRANSAFNSNWHEVHLQIKHFMQKEIRIMREVLANMHEEEVSLIMLDKNSWNHIMQDRSSMLECLSQLREERDLATKRLEEIACISCPGQKLTMEQILPSEEEESSEILFLRDQLFALLEKMKAQNTRNQSLFEQYEHYLHVLPHFHIGRYNQTPSSQKNKASVATYPHDKP